VNFERKLISAVRQSVPFLCATAVYFLLRFNAFGRQLGAFTEHSTTWKTVLLSAPKIVWFYIKVLLWPVRSYGFGDSVTVETFSVHDVLLPAIAVFCVTALLTLSLFWVWRKTQRDTPYREAAGVRCALVLGALLLILPILPALNLNALNPGDFMHGRYAYLSCIGLILLLATGWHLTGRIRALLILPIGLLAVALAVLTYSQEPAWKDNLSVFAVGNQNAPLNRHVALNLARAHVQVALQLVDEGRCEEAVPVFEQATKQFPDDWVGWAALGNCYGQLNDLPQAEQYLRRAAELAHDPRVTEQWQQVRATLEKMNSVTPERSH
jgi:hypothetical protein